MSELKEKLVAIRSQIDEAIASCEDEYEEEDESEEMEAPEGKSGKQSSGKKESVGKIIALMSK